MSYDDSVNLNDDLIAGSDYDSSVISHRGAGKLGSFRTSIDGESTFSGSAIFSGLNHGSIDDIAPDVSPLGPNSIFELTIASDQARIKQRRTKSSVVVNGGLTTVYNLVTPSTNDIPQIQLSKLNKKVSNNQLVEKYIDNVQSDFRKFELSYNILTKDVLDKLNTYYVKTSTPDSDVDSMTDGNELSSIPKVFTDADFRLDDPRIFKKVVENASILPDESNGDITKSLANNTDLQEKFSHYLDIVELNLIQEISKSSDSFFTTMGDIKNIKNQSEDVLKKFNQTSEKLHDLQTNQASKGLAILAKMIERKNVAILESSLLQLSYVTKIFKIANISFSNGNYDKCLDEVVTVESLITGEEPGDGNNSPISFNYPLQDLSRLPALIHINNDLQTLKNECAKGFVNEFTKMLIDDVRSYYQSIPHQVTLNRLFISSDKTRKYSFIAQHKSFQTIQPDFKSKLVLLVQNLVKSGHLIQAYGAYQDTLISEIKSIIKQNFSTQGQTNSNFTQNDDYSLADVSQVSSRASSAPPIDNSDFSSGTNTLSSSIKALSPADFELMIIKTYSNLSECLRRLTTHQKLLLDFALTYIPPSASIDFMSLDITSAINKAIELTQVRITKVINVRLEQIADLPVRSYLRLYSISTSYLQECESINPGYMATGAGSSLNEWYKHHVGYFIHRVHLKALKALVSHVDEETWREVTASSILNESQTIVDEITKYSEFATNGVSGFTGEEWLSLLDFYEGEDKKVVSTSEKHANESNRGLHIGNEMFLVPNLIIKSLPLIRDYLIVSKMFSSLIATLENNLLNYFKLMNSKISQSVLNAGATRTAGLKHITTKHIALCIQTLEFNIAFLPSLEAIFSATKNSLSLLSQNTGQQQQQQDDITFQRITSNYKDHENELFSKLVAIMYDRTVNHCAIALKTNWSEPLTRQQQCHSYMETLVKETLTITKVLTKFLPEIKCSRILLQVFDNYKKAFVTCFCVDLPQPKDMIEKLLILKDIDYFRSNLCDLPGYGNSGQVIWENVNSLPTVEDNQMEEKFRSQVASLAEKLVETKENGSEIKEEKEEQPEPKVTPSEIIFDINKDTPPVTPENGVSKLNGQKEPESGSIPIQDESPTQKTKEETEVFDTSIEESVTNKSTDLSPESNKKGSETKGDSTPSPTEINTDNVHVNVEDTNTVVKYTQLESIHSTDKKDKESNEESTELVAPSEPNEDKQGNDENVKGEGGDENDKTNDNNGGQSGAIQSDADNSSTNGGESAIEKTADGFDDVSLDTTTMKQFTGEHVEKPNAEKHDDQSGTEEKKSLSAVEDDAKPVTDEGTKPVMATEEENKNAVVEEAKVNPKQSIGEQNHKPDFEEHGTKSSEPQAELHNNDRTTEDDLISRKKDTPQEEIPPVEEEKTEADSNANANDNKCGGNNGVGDKQKKKPKKKKKKGKK
jgi:vacuolar protein sorting-associated protein 54